MIQHLNKNCPICGGYVVLLTNGTEMCEKCHYVLPGSNWVYSNTTTSAVKYCPLCNTPLKMEMGNHCWECPNCGYGYIDYIGDLPETKQFSDEVMLHIPCDNVWGVGKISSVDPVALNTLTIERCEKIKLHQKEMDIDFEFDAKKLENIDTIIINGHKFIRDKNMG